MKKIWLSTLLKFYAYVMVVILTIMGLVVAGISWKNQQAEADRIAQRVLTEKEFIAILPCHHRSMRLGD